VAGTDPCHDLASARQPIEVIVEQGQGAWIMPHFGAFADVVEDLLAVQQAPTVDPRPGCSVGSQERRQKERKGVAYSARRPGGITPTTIPMRPP
jgi:hypothetical protein